jgi:hypothetical protein
MDAENLTPPPGFDPRTFQPVVSSILKQFTTAFSQILFYSKFTFSSLASAQLSALECRDFVCLNLEAKEQWFSLSL